MLLPQGRGVHPSCTQFPVPSGLCYSLFLDTHLPRRTESVTGVLFQHDPLLSAFGLSITLPRKPLPDPQPWGPVFFCSVLFFEFFCRKSNQGLGDFDCPPLFFFPEMGVESHGHTVCFSRLGLPDTSLLPSGLGSFCSHSSSSQGQGFVPLLGISVSVSCSGLP